MDFGTLKLRIGWISPPSHHRCGLWKKQSRTPIHSGPGTTKGKEAELSLAGAIYSSWIHQPDRWLHISGANQLKGRSTPKVWGDRAWASRLGRRSILPFPLLKTLIIIMIIINLSVKKMPCYKRALFESTQLIWKFSLNWYNWYKYDKVKSEC